MLRRGATTIKLTPDDILEYDQTVINSTQSYLKDVHLPDQNDQEQDHDHDQDPDSSIPNYKPRNERIGVTNNRNQHPPANQR